MKIVCKNKKNYLKVLISFFLSVVVFCSFSLTVLGATTITATEDNFFVAEDNITYLTFDNIVQSAYVVLYRPSVNQYYLTYSSGTYYYVYNSSGLYACDENGNKVSMYYLPFTDLDSLIVFLTDFNSKTFDEWGKITYTKYNAYMNAEVENVIYNNRIVYKTNNPVEENIALDINTVTGDDSDVNPDDSDQTILEAILTGIKAIPVRFQTAIDTLKNNFVNSIDTMRTDFLESVDNFKSSVSEFFSVLGSSISSKFDEFKEWFSLSDDFGDKLVTACQNSAKNDKTISGLFDFFTNLKDFFDDLQRQHYLNGFTNATIVHHIDYWIDENPNAHPEKYVGDSTGFDLDFSYIGPYMGKIRSIFSVFIWVGFLYRVWFRLPNILQGLASDEAMSEIILPDIATKVKNRKAKKQQKNKTSSKGG